jgi:predicted enzyme related to lactoylglutathione lyase
MKAYVTGIGGVFFKSKDKQKSIDWYKTNLGIEAESWGKVFDWRTYDNPDLPGSTTWSPFENETDYFGNSGQEFMINYRVSNMDELLKNMEANGIKLVKATESHEYGKFAWVDDCDGRRVELWEPIDSAFGL